MITTQQIEDEARTWIGTPFHHQGRLKGVGVDCAGVVVEVARMLGIDDGFVDSRDYARNPDGHMERLLKSHCQQVAYCDRKQGDIVHIAWCCTPQHIGILTKDDKLIHAWGPRGCVETNIGGQMRVRGIYRFKGVS